MSKNIFTPDGGPHRTSRVLDVSDGLKRMGEFEAAEMLAGYAALLRERESAKAGVMDEPRNEFPLLYDNLDALDERAAEQPNRIATARILTELRHQIGCVMTKLHGERAALKTIAPMLASARVPEEMKIPKLGPDQEACDGFVYEYGFSEGFNACRVAMLTAPKPEKE